MERVIVEAHGSYYSIYIGSTKMYHDLRELYLWGNMKHDVAIYVAKCIVCQQVKVEHMRPGGLYQEIVFPEW